MISKFLKTSSSNSISILFILFLSGCGYKPTEKGALQSSYRTISVPYVEGDEEGAFTSILTQTLIQSTPWKYTQGEGDLLLEVKISGVKEEDVGYNWHFNASRQRQRWMDPDEKRLSMLVHITLYDQINHKKILGPIPISDSVKYDFDAEFSEDNLVGFSLAQYNFYENAARIAYKPLSEHITQKIADYLSNYWN